VVVSPLCTYDADPFQSNDKGRSAIDMAQKHEEDVIAAILSSAVHTPTITIDVKSMTHENFEKIISNVLRGRKWVIDYSDNFILTTSYERKKRVYRIETSLHNDRISI